MTFSNVRLDSRGVREVLTRQQTRNVVNGVAGQIRDTVDGIVNDDPDDPIDVTVEPYTTDRSAAAVTIAHPRGRLLQATRGALTRAAARAGLEVRAR